MSSDAATLASATRVPDEHRPRGRVVLRLRGLRRHYPGTRALDWAPGDELEVRAGTVHALLGENGAGKSTTFAAIAGTTRLDAGSMELLGRPHRPRSVGEARTASVELILQEPALIPSLTVAENFVVGRPRGAAAESRAGVLVPGRAGRIAAGALSGIAPHVAPSARVGSLSLEDQKLVELARAVHFRPALLLVDELSACLGRAGLDVLHRVLREQRDAGTAVLYISHYLEEVAEACDVVTVLKDGRLVETLPATTAVDELTRLMVGRPPSELFPTRAARARPTGEPVLRLSDASVAGALAGVSLEVRPGEVLGVAGLVGCGSETLGRLVFGDVRLTGGGMTIDRAPYRPRGSRDAIAAGVAYVPPNRDTEGLVLRASVADNLLLPSLRHRSRAGVYSGLGDAGTVRDLVLRAGIKCRHPRQPPIGLSGGNRQKVVLAKWLVRPPRVLVLHNPTRGIDVGAKAELYAQVRALASAGTAVLLISDELPELLGLSDRLLVMRRGAVTAHLTDLATATEETVLGHMI